MKKIHYSMLLLAAVLGGCLQEENPAAPGKVQFTFQVSPADIAGGRTASDFSDVHYLLISLENSHGDAVFTRHKIDLIPFGNSFISDPLELMPGNYKITDFLLTDAAENVLYATPKKDSPLASAVSHPLPYAFQVSKNNVSNIEVEVVDVDHRNPEDFGYASFSINEARAFQISVFVNENGDMNLTSAHGYIFEQSAILQDFAIDPKVNTVNFTGDPEKSYVLTIQKDGYGEFTRVFTYNSLLEELDGKPLKIILTPATLTMTTSESDFQMSLVGAGYLNVNWGDGTTETVYGDLAHTYSDAGPHNIVVTGDIKNITEFYSYYGQGDLDALNVEHLPNLTEIRFGLSDSPAIIDLSHNSKLEFLNMSGLTQLHELKLPADHRIHTISIDGPNEMGTAEIDAVIDNIHANAIKHEITGGFFNLNAEWFTQEPGIMVGPPSAGSIEKLQHLRDTYSWTISPENF